MSQRHQQEIQMAATRAALEAAGRERARCLWVLEELLKRAQLGMDKKLMTATETQVAKVRAEITKTIVIAAKTLILSGARPQHDQQNPSGRSERTEPAGDSGQASQASQQP